MHAAAKRNLSLPLFCLCLCLCLCLSLSLCLCLSLSLSLSFPLFSFRFDHSRCVYLPARLEEMFAVSTRVGFEVRAALPARLERPLHGQVRLAQHLRARLGHLQGGVPPELRLLQPRGCPAHRVVLQPVGVYWEYTIREHSGA